MMVILISVYVWVVLVVLLCWVFLFFIGIYFWCNLLVWGWNVVVVLLVFKVRMVG